LDRKARKALEEMGLPLFRHEIRRREIFQKAAKEEGSVYGLKVTLRTEGHAKGELRRRDGRYSQRY
jgi:hypothetical protein